MEQRGAARSARVQARPGRARLLGSWWTRSGSSGAPLQATPAARSGSPGAVARGTGWDPRSRRCSPAHGPRRSGGAWSCSRPRGRRQHPAPSPRPSSPAAVACVEDAEARAEEQAHPKHACRRAEPLRSARGPPWASAPAAAPALGVRGRGRRGRVPGSGARRRARPDRGARGAPGARSGRRPLRRGRGGPRACRQRATSSDLARCRTPHVSSKYASGRRPHAPRAARQPVLRLSTCSYTAR